ncbi:MAG: hypothetical protein AB7N69_00405 [Immundisolibacter sp.]
MHHRRSSARTCTDLHQLWGRGVVLDTTVHDKAATLVFDDGGFKPKLAA